MSWWLESERTSDTASSVSIPRWPRVRHAAKGMPSGPGAELLLVVIAFFMCLILTCHLLDCEGSLGCIVLGVEWGPEWSSVADCVCWFVRLCLVLCACCVVLWCGFCACVCACCVGACACACCVVFVLVLVLVLFCCACACCVVLWCFLGALASC